MSGVDNNPVCVEGLRFNFLVFNQYVCRFQRGLGDMQSLGSLCVLGKVFEGNNFHHPHHERSRLVKSGRPDPMPEAVVDPGGVVHQRRLPAAEVEGKLKYRILLVPCVGGGVWWMGRASFINLNRALPRS